MDPFEGTLLGECGRTELWIYTFILVLRLRKVKQSAIWFCTIFSRSCCPCRPWDTSANPPLLKWSCTEQPETGFYHKTGKVSPTLHSWIMEGLRLHAFRCGLLSFDGSLVMLNILQDGVVSFRFRFPGTGCLAFRSVGAYGSVRFAEMIGSFRFVSHLFNIFSVSFRFRFTDRLWLQWAPSRKKYYILESLRFRTIGKDSRFESL